MTRILAIDGPAGAGKTTISKAAAVALGWRLVDTGAVYRSVALMAQRRQLSSEAEIAAAIETMDLQFDGSNIRLEGDDITTAIRTPDISQQASKVSALPAVRAGLLELQRRLAHAHETGAVVEGRDIGTVVFPDAELKVFLTASEDERAQRRCDELERRGTPQKYDDVLADIQQRDRRDSSRAVAPLKAADDAHEIDTTGRSIDDIVAEIVRLAEGNLTS